MTHYTSFRPTVTRCLFLALVTAFLASSCKDDEVAAPANPLMGTWVMESLAISNCIDPEENGSVTAVCTSGSCSKIIMAREGAFTVSTVLNNMPHEDTGTYLVKDDVIEICVQGGTACSNVAYELFDNNHKLRFTDGDSGCKSVTTYKKL